MVKNPPANAGDKSSIPGLGRSHMPRSNEARAPQLLSLGSRAREPLLLSPCATTTEARVPRARAPQREATAMRSPCTATKSSPPTTHHNQRKPASSNEDPVQPKINKFIKKKFGSSKTSISFFHQLIFSSTGTS